MVNAHLWEFPNLEPAPGMTTSNRRPRMSLESNPPRLSRFARSGTRSRATESPSRRFSWKGSGAAATQSPSGAVAQSSPTWAARFCERAQENPPPPRQVQTVYSTICILDHPYAVALDDFAFKSNDLGGFGGELVVDWLAVSDHEAKPVAAEQTDGAARLDALFGAAFGFSPLAP